MALRTLLLAALFALVLPGAADAALLGYQGDRRLAPSTTPAPGGDSMLVLVGPRDGYATARSRCSAAAARSSGVTTRPPS